MDLSHNIPVVSKDYMCRFVATMARHLNLNPNHMTIAYEQFEKHKKEVGLDFIGNPEEEAETALFYLMDS
jgi:hypothetical protein